MRYSGLLIIKTVILSSCATVVDPGPQRLITPCRLDVKTMRYECSSGSGTPMFYVPVSERGDFVCYPPDNIPDLIR